MGFLMQINDLFTLTALKATLGAHQHVDGETSEMRNCKSKCFMMINWPWRSVTFNWRHFKVCGVAVGACGGEGGSGKLR